MAKLIVRREAAYQDSIRRYRILLDGVEIGRLSAGETLEQDISDSAHRIEAKVDWCGSQPMEFDGRLGESVVVVRGALHGWRIFLVGFFILFRPRRYLELELIQRNRCR
jgi:hypothetical protein